MNQIRTYHYIISELCNLDCSYCNVNTFNSVYQSDDDFYKFYQTIESDNFKFDIFGGEPFLHLDQVEFIISVLEDDDRCKSIAIPTNGTIYNKRILAIINHPKVSVSISYDGINQLSYRGLCLAPEMKKLMGNKIKSVHCMITGSMYDNQDSNSNMLIRNHNLKINNMTLIRDNNSWTIQQADKFLNDLKSYIKVIFAFGYNTMNEIPSLIRIYLSSYLNYAIFKVPQSDCGIGDTYQTILADSTVTDCERFSRNDIIYTEDLKNSVLSECKTCNIKNYCNKGCIYEQIVNTKPMHELCYIYKGIYLIIKDYFIIEPIKFQEVVELFIKEKYGR